MIDGLSASEDAQALMIYWVSGERSTLSAATLRREARDAWTRRAQMDGIEVPISDDLHITALHQIGREGVNVHFSDGHDKAIYPFVYLRELSDRFDN